MGAPDPWLHLQVPPYVYRWLAREAAARNQAIEHLVRALLSFAVERLSAPVAPSRERGRHTRGARRRT